MPRICDDNQIRVGIGCGPIGCLRSVTNGIARNTAQIHATIKQFLGRIGGALNFRPSCLFKNPRNQQAVSFAVLQK